VLSPWENPAKTKVFTEAGWMRPVSGRSTFLGRTEVVVFLRLRDASLS